MQSTASPDTDAQAALPFSRLGEVLEALASAGVSSARFSETGCLLEVKFFATVEVSPSVREEPDDGLALTETEKASIRLATRGQNRGE